ncbi:MAG: FecR family protein [Acidobacteriia bacterium]|nr:FecR family protein [Terriglobia bacterium]
MSIRKVGYALLLSALVCAGLPAWADSLARIVRLSYVDGDVQIDRGTGRGFERAVLNLPVVQGAQLATRDSASAEVEFEDGSTLRLIPNTSVAFHELGLRSSGERVSGIDLIDGTVYLEATRKKDDFTITTGSQTIALTHPARFRISRSGSEVRLAVFKGDVDARTESGSVRVKKDETFALNLEDPSQYQLAKGVDEESYDAWNRERDQYRETYASTHHEGYNSQYNYGYSDLNYFGSFAQYSSYGLLWRPYNVGPSWDPFGDGAWMYYPGHGYMWVSAYPWGWMPYRYGSWIYVPGYGWAWRPARTWNTWYAVPVIYRAPVGYVAPQPPMVKTTPGVVPGTVVVGKGPIDTVRSERFTRWTLDQERKANTSAAKKGRVSPVPPSSAVSPAAPAATAPATTTPAPSAAPGVHSHRRADVDRDAGMKKGAGGTAPSVAPVPRSAPPAAAPPPPAATHPRSSSSPSSTKTGPHFSDGSRSSASSGGSTSHSSGSASRSTSSSSSGSKSTGGEKK